MRLRKTLLMRQSKATNKRSCYTTTIEKYKLVREEVLGEGGGWCGEGGGGKQRMIDGL